MICAPHAYRQSIPVLGLIVSLYRVVDNGALPTPSGVILQVNTKLSSRVKPIISKLVPFLSRTLPLSGEPSRSVTGGRWGFLYATVIRRPLIRTDQTVVTFSGMVRSVMGWSTKLLPSTAPKGMGSLLPGGRSM